MKGKAKLMENHNWINYEFMKAGGKVIIHRLVALLLQIMAHIKYIKERASVAAISKLAAPKHLMNWFVIKLLFKRTNG